MWPYGWLWGDREERKAVRNYLKIIWEENVDTVPVTYDTLETTRTEKNEILQVHDNAVSCNAIRFFFPQWWWNNRYGQGGKVDTTNDYFGQWLLTQYRDSNKIDYASNKGRARNY